MRKNPKLFHRFASVPLHLAVMDTNTHVCIHKHMYTHTHLPLAVMGDSSATDGMLKERHRVMLLLLLLLLHVYASPAGRAAVLQ